MTVFSSIRTGLLCLACAGAGVATYQWLLGDPGEAQAGSVAYAARPEGSSVEPLGAEEPTQNPDSRVILTGIEQPIAQDNTPSEPAASAGRLAEPWELEAQPVPAPTAPFEKKYAGWTFEELKDTYVDQMFALQKECRAAFQERHEAGLSQWREFEEETVEAENGEPKSVGAFHIQGDSRGLFVQAGTDHFGDSFRPYAVWLPADQYPDMYKKRDELSWINVRLGNLKMAGLGPK